MRKIVKYFLLIFNVPLLANAEPVGLIEVVNHLNNIKSLKADFSQLNNDGSISEGILYIKKPGKLRMSYEVPGSSLIIVKDKFLTVLDLKSSGSYQKLSIAKNPLMLLLSSKFELDADDMNVDFKSDNVTTTLNVSDLKNFNQGYLEVTFNNNPLTLEKWLLVNSLNEKIEVHLTEILFGEKLGDDLFDPDLEINKMVNKP